jgi:hypothetical protein
VFELATTADDIERIHRAGKIASLIGMEGGYSIDDSLGLLRESSTPAGARYMTLTHSKTTTWADSATDAPKWGGLNPFGEAVVREMNRLGMMVDLPCLGRDHAGRHPGLGGAGDLLPLLGAGGDRPCAQCARQRPEADARERRDRHGHLRAGLRQRGGAPLERRSGGRGGASEDPEPRRPNRGPKGWPWPPPIRVPHASIADVVAHIQHVRDVAGIDHVGLGGDFDGVESLPDGITGVDAYPAILAALMAAGWTEADIRKLAGENMLRVMRAVEAVARAKANEPPGMATNGDGPEVARGPEKTVPRCQTLPTISRDISGLEFSSVWRTARLCEIRTPNLRAVRAWAGCQRPRWRWEGRGVAQGWIRINSYATGGYQIVVNATALAGQDPVRRHQIVSLQREARADGQGVGRRGERHGHAVVSCTLKPRQAGLRAVELHHAELIDGDLAQPCQGFRMVWPQSRAHQVERFLIDPQALILTGRIRFGRLDQELSQLCGDDRSYGGSGDAFSGVQAAVDRFGLDDARIPGDVFRGVEQGARQTDPRHPQVERPPAAGLAEGDEPTRQGFGRRLVIARDQQVDAALEFPGIAQLTPGDPEAHGVGVGGAVHAVVDPRQNIAGRACVLEAPRSQFGVEILAQKGLRLVVGAGHGQQTGQGEAKITRRSVVRAESAAGARVSLLRQGQGFRRSADVYQNGNQPRLDSEGPRRKRMVAAFESQQIAQKGRRLAGATRPLPFDRLTPHIVSRGVARLGDRRGDLSHRRVGDAEGAREKRGDQDGEVMRSAHVCTVIRPGAAVYFHNLTRGASGAPLLRRPSGMVSGLAAAGAVKPGP